MEVRFRARLCVYRRGKAEMLHGESSCGWMAVQHCGYLRTVENVHIVCPKKRMFIRCAMEKTVLRGKNPDLGADRSDFTHELM